MSSNRPSPPSDLPAYLTDPLERQSPDRLETLLAYIEHLLAHHRSRASQDLTDDDLTSEAEMLVDTGETTSGTVVVKRVPCGKDCEGCPHGPYKYVVRRESDGLNWDYRGTVDE